MSSNNNDSNQIKPYKPRPLNLFKKTYSFHLFDNWVSNGHVAFKLDFFKSLKGAAFSNAKKQVEREVVKIIQARLMGDAQKNDFKLNTFKRYFADFEQYKETRYETPSLSEFKRAFINMTSTLAWQGSRAYAFDELYCGVFFVKGASVYFDKNETLPAVVTYEGEPVALVMPMRVSDKTDLSNFKTINYKQTKKRG